VLFFIGKIVFSRQSLKISGKKKKQNIIIMKCAALTFLEVVSFPGVMNRNSEM